eukprot:Platyproteum_vivax@DN1205_c0_g1_i1.p1
MSKTNIFYRVREVHRFDHNGSVYIVMENQQRCSALPAVANALILKRLVTIPDEYTAIISEKSLLSLVAGYIKLRNGDTQDPNIEMQLEEALAVVMDLGERLDVNARFRSPGDFDFTGAISMFDLLGIDIFHTWVIESEDPILPLVQNMSEKQLLREISDYRNSSDKSTEMDMRIGQYEKFLSEHEHKLTTVGLERLLESLNNHHVSVVATRSSFVVMVKTVSGMFTLAASERFSKSEVVWLGFHANDTTEYCYNSNFLPIVEREAPQIDRLTIEEVVETKETETLAVETAVTETPVEEETRKEKKPGAAMMC